MMATLLHWTGEISEVRPKDPVRGFTRSELCDILGATEIQIDSLFDGRIMAHISNRRAFPNGHATTLYRKGRGTGLAITGDALVASPAEIE